MPDYRFHTFLLSCRIEKYSENSSCAGRTSLTQPLFLDIVKRFRKIASLRVSERARASGNPARR